MVSSGPIRSHRGAVRHMSESGTRSSGGRSGLDVRTWQWRAHRSLKPTGQPQTSGYMEREQEAVLGPEPWAPPAHRLRC